MHTLAPHPQSPSSAVRRLAAQVRRTGEATLSLTYVLEGELGGVRIPQPMPPRMVPGLWRHTCCEIFVARAGLPGYHEFNLSPSGEWAAHAFERYREGGMLADAAFDPCITVRRGARTLELDALIRMGNLEGKLLVGLSAVLEAADGSLSYWALRHPAGPPDFHHRHSFALELA